MSYLKKNKLLQMKSENNIAEPDFLKNDQTERAFPDLISSFLPVLTIPPISFTHGCNLFLENCPSIRFKRSR